MKKENIFLCYILVSLSILLLAFVNSVSVANRIIILAIAAFFLVALKHHFHEVKSSIDRSDERKRLDYENILLVIGTGLSAAITWYINHTLGYGPVIANGLVGLFFSSKNAGAFYTASFIGMSSLGIVPSMTLAGVIGLVAGIVIIFSQEVYAGVGGKGGTTAALSTQLIRILLDLFT